jgi:hypothetical protein
MWRLRIASDRGPEHASYSHSSSRGSATCAQTSFHTLQIEASRRAWPCFVRLPMTYSLRDTFLSFLHHPCHFCATYRICIDVCFERLSDDQQSPCPGNTVALTRRASCPSPLRVFMSASASSSKAIAPTETEKESTKESTSVPTLGVLEEDDEFEEFPVQGIHHSASKSWYDAIISRTSFFRLGRLAYAHGSAGRRSAGCCAERRQQAMGRQLGRR